MLANYPLPSTPTRWRTLLPALLVSLGILAGCSSSPDADLDSSSSTKDIRHFFSDLDRDLKAWSTAESHQQISRAEELGRQIGRKVRAHYSFIVSALNGSNRWKQAIAAAAVGFSNDERFCSSLQFCLQSPDETVQINTLTSLGNLRYRWAPQKQILQFLEHDRAELRASAAYLLGRILTPSSAESAIGPLMRHTADPDRNVRINAIIALAEIGDYHSTPALTDRLLGDPDPAIRSLASQALFRLKGEPALAGLMEGLRQEEEPTVRKNIIISLEKSSHKNFGDNSSQWEEWWTRRLASPETGPESSRSSSSKILRALGPHVGKDVPKNTQEPTLVRTPPNRNVPATSRTQESSSSENSGTQKPSSSESSGTQKPSSSESPEESPPGVKESPDVQKAFYYLREGTPAEIARAKERLINMKAEILPGVLNRLPNANTIYAQRLIELLVEIRDPSVAPSLASLFSSRANSVVQLEILDALSTLGGDEVSETAHKGLQSEWSSVRLKSARILYDIEDTASIPVLIGFLEDRDILNRFTVFDALRRATGETFGYLPRGSQSERRAAVTRWKAWWTDQGSTFRFRE
ncbi:MAG: HEAT repeat domain-containing protein [Planctomycetota bacterium]|nr:HEAT repeat domain-containing protein [Planctomycetota bacterium]